MLKDTPGAVDVMPKAAKYPPMDLTLGCMFVGMVLNVFLYGMSIVQGYLYFVNFKTDKLFMRIFIGILLTADTLNAVMDTGFMYQYLISNFGNLVYGELRPPGFSCKRSYVEPLLTT